MKEQIHDRKAVRRAACHPAGGLLAAQTEGTPPPALDNGKLKKFGSIITRGKARQAYDEGMKTFGQSKGDEAIAKFTEALSHIDHRELSLWNLKRPEEALKEFDIGILKAPRIYSFHESRAMLLASLKQPERALADYDMLVALQPLYPSNLERRARHLREMGRNKEADEDQRQANQLREAGF